MQTNYTQFRPDLKGVKVIKSYFFENTYHINAKRWNVNTLVDNFYKDNC